MLAFSFDGRHYSGQVIEYPTTINIYKNKALTQLTLDVQNHVIQCQWFMIHIYPQIKADKYELTEINI